MITYREIQQRLKEIHENYGPQISQEAFDKAIAEGMHNPCGCDICNLMNEITFAELELMQKEREKAQP